MIIPVNPCKAPVNPFPIVSQFNCMVLYVSYNNVYVTYMRKMYRVKTYVEFLSTPTAVVDYSFSVLFCQRVDGIRYDGKCEGGLAGKCIVPRPHSDLSAAVPLEVGHVPAVLLLIGPQVTLAQKRDTVALLKATSELAARDAPSVFPARACNNFNSSFQR